MLGVRSGFKTPTNLVTSIPLPGHLRHLIGATVTNWHSLPPNVSYDIETDIPDLKGPIYLWAESLLPMTGVNNATKAKQLVNYSSGPFKSNAAFIKNQVGNGSMYYLGWYPTVSQSKAILKNIASEITLEYINDLPSGLILTKRDPYNIIFNFTDQPQMATIHDQKVKISARDLTIIKSEDLQSGNR